MEDNVTWEQSDLGPYCLQYKLLTNINRLGKQKISGLIMVHLKKKVKLCERHNSNLNLCVFFVKRMCKLSTN